MALAPSNLKIVTSGKTSVTVGWTEATGATAYRLYRDNTFVSNTGPAARQAKFGALTRKAYVFGIESVTPQGNFKSTISVSPSGSNSWTVTGTNVPPDPTPPPTDTWTQVAVEWENFILGQTAEVRYGKDNSWFTKTLAAGTHPCTNANFGGDPLPGTPKVCQVRSSGSGGGGTPPPTAPNIAYSQPTQVIT